jgi:hypothetical protein
MHRESRSILFACALGAFIGSLILLELAHHFKYGHYFWPLGALLGGVVGWTTVDFRQFCTGVRHAGRRAINWRPEYLWWKAFGVAMSAVISLLSTPVPILLYFKSHLYLIPDTFAALAVVTGLILAVWVIAGFAVLFVAVHNLLFVSNNYNDEWYDTRNEYLEAARSYHYKMLRQWNPISVIVGAARLFWIALCMLAWLIIHIPTAIETVARGTPVVATALKNFAVGVFINVHSARRKLCFVDSAIGAGIGYYFGSALIGAAAGAVLGIVNYELVSIRWLKLVPASR